MRRLQLLLLLLAALLGLPRGSRAEPTTDGLYAGFVTSLGTFWCALEFERVPRTVANFVTLAEGTRDWIDFPSAKIVRRPFYDNTTFHRVIDKFMIQGGSRNALGTDGPGYRFADEFHTDLKHSAAGTLSMANSGEDSNGAQFFVTVTNTPHLDGVHSVFGRVVEGLDVVHDISKVPRDTANKPVTPVNLTQVLVLRRGPAAEGFNPAAVTPALPDVGVVPTALLYTPDQLDLRLQSRTNHYQHAFFGPTLDTWTVQTFPSSPTNLNASSLLGGPRLFFRVLDGGVEK